MKDADNLILIYSTIGTQQEAQKLAHALVEKRLAACVNIFPTIVSVYRWQGKVDQASETALLVKTKASLKDQILEEMARQHPYSTPALIVLNPETVSAPYLNWALTEVNS